MNSGGSKGETLQRHSYVSIHRMVQKYQVTQTHSQREDKKKYCTMHQAESACNLKQRAEMSGVRVKYCHHRMADGQFGGLVVPCYTLTLKRIESNEAEQARTPPQSGHEAWQACMYK